MLAKILFSITIKLFRILLSLPDVYVFYIKKVVQPDKNPKRKEFSFRIFVEFGFMKRYSLIAEKGNAAKTIM